MQAAKSMAATVKQKMGIAAAHVEEKKEDTKFAAEEKVDLMRAHGDEGAKEEATAKKNEREAGAEQHREAEQAQYAEDKERVANPQSGSIGAKPTPADLDRAMGADNPTNPENPEYSSQPNAGAMLGAGRSNPVVPTYLGPATGNSIA